MNIEQEVAKILLSTSAVALRTNPPFTWNTGLISPIYCDNRILLSYPTERRFIIERYKEVIANNKLDFDVIAGTATAGIPWAAFVALELNKPLVYVRSHPKNYGTAKCVEGKMENGDRVLIIEDLISTGRSSLASITACKKEYSAKIVATIAIFTYEIKKAAELYAAEQVPLYALSNFSTLLNIASDSNYITTEQKQIALAWNADPENWLK